MASFVPKTQMSRWSAAVVAVGLLVIAINLLVAWRNDVELRQLQLEDAQSDGRKMLMAFVDNAERLLDYGDSNLRSARAVYQRMGASEGFREFLAATKVLHSESLIAATTFSDRDGQIVLDSEKRQVPNVTAAGLDYFNYFQSHDKDDPYIDPTRFGRVWQQYLFRIVRRLSRNGHFDGVAILNMRPEHLANFTRQFDLGPHVTYTILTLDHRLIVRQPMAPEAAYNERQDSLQLWGHLEEAASGMYRGASQYDGRTRMILYQKLPNYPLVVQLGIDEQDILDNRSSVRIPNVKNAAAFTIVTCVFCLLVVLILRKSDALEETLLQLRNSNYALEKLSNDLRELARTDFLTGLANRRAFLGAINGELLRSKRFDSKAAVLMIDIDHFKQVNDSYGHEAGDRASVALATLLKTMARTTDLPARVGGEEFVFLLTGSDALGAMEMAERIRSKVAQMVLTSPSGKFGITVSIGVAAFVDEDQEGSEPISRADKAMYRAKALGRNKVVGCNDDRRVDT